ncbi:hypothetical protein FPV67DRAFT_387352 [Lyophyllum atratum]|nr:hypothetical protein FPV67DRAFT_387352 [Lyophyllum atratum]
MVALLHVLSAAALFASSALANPAPSDMLHGLLTRQIQPIDTSNIPAQCKPDCQAVSDGLVGCSTVECICKDSLVSSMGKCLSCGVAIAGSGVDVATAQNVIDQMVSACKSAGTPVKQVTVSAKGADSKGNGAAHTAAMSAGAFAAAAFGAIVALA